MRGVLLSFSLLSLVIWLVWVTYFLVLVHIKAKKELGTVHAPSFPYHRLVISLPSEGMALSQDFRIVWSEYFPNATLVFSETDEYPPVNHNFDVWESLVGTAKWYTRCDYDAYLNYTLLLQKLAMYSPDTPLLLGFLGHGRPQDQGYLNISNFAMGGFCETVSNVALARIDFDACRNNSMLVPKLYRHSDTEFSKCAAGHEVRIESLPGEKLANYAVQRSSTIPSLDMCKKISKDVVVAHPIKDPVHLALTLRQQAYLGKDRTCACSASPIHTYVQTSCGAGKKFKPLDPCGEQRPRCATGYATTVLPIDVHIIGFNASSRIKDVPGCLGTKIHVHTPVEAKHKTRLKKGEASLLQTMLGVLEIALQRDRPFITLEDDFILHKDMCKRWESARRCYDNAMRGNGLFLFGHTIWNPDAWSIGQCLDATKHTYGTFAIAYSVLGARAVLEWLQQTLFLRPYDHMYQHLVERNHAVRIMWPPAIVADVSHKSLTNFKPIKSNVSYRHKLHRWGGAEEFHRSLN